MVPRIASALSVLLFILCFGKPPQTPGTTIPPPRAGGQQPERITVCQLKADPAKYNHKLLEVTGFISHGFEDFELFDPDCPTWPGVWLEYGGTNKSGTMYCCGVTAERTRPKQVIVEKIPIPLVVDEPFRELDKLIQRRPDSVVHATVAGRFFSGEEVEYPGGKSWSGYGHMGCCTLFMIQQVLSVDPHDRNDLDYGASADQPGIDKAGCGYKFLRDERRGLIKDQQEAELGGHDWVFADPHRVATDFLARTLKVEQSSVSGLKQTRQAQGRFVYEWRPVERKATYMVVVSRPYLLSFYARDPKKIAWVATAGYESSCSEGNSVTLVGVPPRRKPKTRRH
jgi:hypothetical protein